MYISYTGEAILIRDKLRKQGIGIYPILMQAQNDYVVLSFFACWGSPQSPKNATFRVELCVHY